MRDYGKVHTSFWTSDTIRGMTEDARTLAFYLLTSPHSTIAGVFRLPDGYVCEDLQWDSTRVAEGFRELFDKGFANRCETTKWVWVVKHLEWNPPENPNQRKAVAKLAHSIPDACAWKLDFMRVCGEVPTSEQPETPNHSQTVPEPFLNQKQEQEQEQEQEEHPCASADARDRPGRATTSDGFEQFWAAYPKRVSKGAARKAWAKLKPSEQLLQAILAGIGRAKTSAQWLRDDGRFVPHPATWLNAEGWLDDPPTGGGKSDDQWWLGSGFGTRESAIAAGAREPA